MIKKNRLIYVTLVLNNKISENKSNIVNNNINNNNHTNIMSEAFKTAHTTEE
ncbi:hypothetical protein HIC20_01680 [Buchnera aphidicola (Hormaphis cornu)]|nr:hypothetical protein HIC20_01680 [Buchnera aphidicola (Hormaphis cornu)]